MTMTPPHIFKPCMCRPDLDNVPGRAKHTAFASPAGVVPAAGTGYASKVRPGGSVNVNPLVGSEVVLPGLDLGACKKKIRVAMQKSTHHRWGSVIGAQVEELTNCSTHHRVVVGL